MRVWSREVLFKSLVGEKKEVLSICKFWYSKTWTKHNRAPKSFLRFWLSPPEFSIFILSPLCPFLCFSHILRNPIFKTWKKANKTLRHSPYLYKSPLLIFHFVMSISWVCLRTKLPPSNPTNSKNLPSDWNIQILCGTPSFQNQNPITIVDSCLASMKKTFCSKIPNTSQTKCTNSLDL